MSHYLWLESPPWPRMPEGRKDELRSYYESGGPSLEAKDVVPLFWQAMFDLKDIRHAAVIDGFDPKTEAEGLAEYLANTAPEGREATYPYLVTNKSTALDRLQARREVLLAGSGNRYRVIYEAFVDYVRTAYGDYVLLRTQDVPDIEDGESWMREMLEDMSRLQDGRRGGASAIAVELQSLRNASDEDAVWMATGVADDDELHPWPTSELINIFPACDLTRPVGKRQDTDSYRRYSKPETWVGRLKSWATSGLLAGVFLGTYAYTRSTWLSVLATILVMAPVIWLWLRYGDG